MDKKELQGLTTKLMSNWRDIDALYFEYAKSVGLSYLSLAVLEFIFSSENGCTQKEIVEALNLPKQTVNVIVKSFLDQGYIGLKEVSSDRRNKAITLSDSGWAYAKRVIGHMRAAEVKAMENLTEEQRQEVLGITNAIKTGLQAHLVVQDGDKNE